MMKNLETFEGPIDPIAPQPIDPPGPDIGDPSPDEPPPVLRQTAGSVLPGPLRAQRAYGSCSF